MRILITTIRALALYVVFHMPRSDTRFLNKMRFLRRPWTLVLAYFCSIPAMLWLIPHYTSLCTSGPTRMGDVETHLTSPYPMDDINRVFKEKQLHNIEQQLKENRNNLEDLAVRLRKQYPDAAGDITDSINPRNKSIPTIYAITPTYTRPVQKAELTRIAQSFLHVKHFHWIVVEDANNKTSMVINFLKNSGMKYTHLNFKIPEYKLPKNAKWRKPRGVEQRNTAIEWLLKNVDANKNPGVVYFADDDNTYDLQIFHEMRDTKKVSIWPVAFVGGQLYERPKLDNNTGKVVGWIVGFDPKRPFAVDMAGFAVNLKLLQEKPSAKFDLKAAGGHQESSLLIKLVKMEDLEPKADMCTKVYVWHTRTAKPNMVYRVKEPGKHIDV